MRPFGGLIDGHCFEIGTHSMWSVCASSGYKGLWVGRGGGGSRYLIYTTKASQNFDKTYIYILI